MSNSHSRESSSSSEESFPANYQAEAAFPGGFGGFSVEESPFPENFADFQVEDFSFPVSSDPTEGQPVQPTTEGEDEQTLRIDPGLFGGVGEVRSLDPTAGEYESQFMPLDHQRLIEAFNADHGLGGSDWEADVDFAKYVNSVKEGESSQQTNPAEARSSQSQPTVAESSEREEPQPVVAPQPPAARLAHPRKIRRRGGATDFSSLSGVEFTFNVAPPTTHQQPQQPLPEPTAEPPKDKGKGKEVDDGRDAMAEREALCKSKEEQLAGREKRLQAQSDILEQEKERLEGLVRDYTNASSEASAQAATIASQAAVVEQLNRTIEQLNHDAILYVEGTNRDHAAMKVELQQARREADVSSRNLRQEVNRNDSLRAELIKGKAEHESLVQTLVQKHKLEMDQLREAKAPAEPNADQSRRDEELADQVRRNKELADQAQRDKALADQAHREKELADAQAKATAEHLRRSQETVSTLEKEKEASNAKIERLEKQPDVSHLRLKIRRLEGDVAGYASEARAYDAYWSRACTDNTILRDQLRLVRQEVARLERQSRDADVLEKEKKALEAELESAKATMGEREMDAPPGILARATEGLRQSLFPGWKLHAFFFLLLLFVGLLVATYLAGASQERKVWVESLKMARSIAAKAAAKAAADSAKLKVDPLLDFASVMYEATG
ncbi:hypothetical protein MMC07_000580 [Pseudocyphellaria aurata]|nr:hypothetical protein [Pseudocyphellaria aurata]